MAVARMSVDRQLTFEILLYLNIFYYCLYAGMQALFLLIKYVYVQDMGNAVTILTITNQRQNTTFGQIGQFRLFQS